MKKIKNYEELVSHRRYLESNLRDQKAYFNNRIAQVREKFEPISKVVSFFQSDNKAKVNTLINNSSSLLKIGSTAGIDLLLQNRLAKAGWLTKLVLPFVLRFAAARTLEKVQHKSV